MISEAHIRSGYKVLIVILTVVSVAFMLWAVTWAATVLIRFGSWLQQRRRQRAEWISECMQWRGVVLKGEKRHYCYDWDGLPVDETCDEFQCCHCFDDGYSL